jgi:hypothetical protein
MPVIVERDFRDATEVTIRKRKEETKTVTVTRLGGRLASRTILVDTEASAPRAGFMPRYLGQNVR